MATATLHASVSADEAEILALGAALYKAHLDKNPEGIAAPFAPHAAIYDLEPPLSHDGISVERKRKWLATWETPIEITAENFKVVVSGDLAYGHGYLRMSGTKKGAGPVSFWMRETMCVSSGSTAHGRLFTSTHRCRSIWMAACVRRST